MDNNRIYKAKEEEEEFHEMVEYVDGGIKYYSFKVDNYEFECNIFTGKITIKKKIFCSNSFF